MFNSSIKCFCKDKIECDCNRRISDEFIKSKFKDCKFSCEPTADPSYFYTIKFNDFTIYITEDPLDLTISVFYKTKIIKSFANEDGNLELIEDVIKYINEYEIRN